MWRCLAPLSLAAAFYASEPLRAEEVGNLLRNGSFQDDWLTLIPETKNHHWCYSSEFYNRRDFNPDGWTCKGSWEWLNADAPAGQRRFILHGPNSFVSQRVNWVLVHDYKKLGSMADAGGFPQIKPVRSRMPERLVRDLTLRVRLQGKDVPAKAGAIDLGLCPPGSITISDPFGTMTNPTVNVTTPLPEGTYADRLVEVKLPARRWVEAVRTEAGKNPKEAAQVTAAGPVLPGTVQVKIRYAGGKGQVEIMRVELFEAGPDAPNLLPGGGFNEVGKSAARSWSPAVKYTHFPGRLYYLFNTWHNAAFPNRGGAAADALTFSEGAASLCMTVPPGDETAVLLASVPLKQTQARLIEVHARVLTSKLAMLHIEAVDENGERLDCFPFIHMAPLSVGSDGWRVIRQVFQPRKSLKSVRLSLCARGVNGYTLDDTSVQPENNVAGAIWWDDVRLFEPESNETELRARGLTLMGKPARPRTPHLQDLDIGECLLGQNLLSARVVNPGAEANYALGFTFTSPAGKRTTVTGKFVKIPRAGSARISVAYELAELCPRPYTDFSGHVMLLQRDGNETRNLVGSKVRFGTWTVPIKLQLGALYLRPKQKQLVRTNFGFSAAMMQQLASVQLDLLRRGTGAVLKTWTIPADPQAILKQRQRLPKEIRDDLANLLLTDLDISFLTLQAFNDPRRNWLIRARALDKEGKPLATVESPPFCRQAHDLPQEPARTVTIKNDLLFVNAKPWMPWGAVYGHVPVYDGPADPGAGKYLNLHNLPAWSMYDRFTAEPYTRQKNDFNCLRYVAGSITDPKVVEERWRKDNLYASTAFAVPQPVFSLEELKNAGTANMSANLDYYKDGPVISVSPGIEEAFGLFHAAKPAQLKGLEQVVDYLRRTTGKPGMVGHGGYWNRFEFEKVPFFDIFDPETEPLYPANLHTDLRPLLAGKNKVIWLRPQMYEDVPYERWRFHTYVELMRGCRGWQIAHGPGDQSLFRGLHGEMEFWKPIIYSTEAPPSVTMKPNLEHWTRRYNGKTYLIAASTRGLTLGNWIWHNETAPSPGGRRSRITESRSRFLHEANSYGADQQTELGPAIHGIHHLPDAHSWPGGSKLVQWVFLEDNAPPKNLVILLKKDGRWTHAASWGKFNPETWSKDTANAAWFLHSFYRHSYGFLGWDLKLLEKAKQYIPSRSDEMGKLPPGGKWVRLEVPLEAVGAADGLLDGVAFAHEGGRVRWGHTALLDPAGHETVVWGDAVGHVPEQLAKTRIDVPGMKTGTPVRVLFEDRELRAGDGFFVDDFRGQDLYQRFGGGYGVGYGDGSVALHLYQISGP